MSILAGVGEVSMLLRSAEGLVNALRSGHGKSESAQGAGSFSEALQKASEKFIAQRDLDGDGMLSPAEFGASATAFQRFDLNGDQKISQAELIQARKGMANEHKLDRLFAKYDSDADGVLSTLESGLSAEQFAAYDLNADGALSRSEMAQATGLTMPGTVEETA